MSTQEAPVARFAKAPLRARVRALSWLLVPIAVAIALHVVFVASNWSSPFFRAPLVDAKDFNDAARDLVSGHGLPARPYDRPPLFIYFAAGLYRVFGTDPRVVILAHAVLGVATAALTAIAGRALFGARAGALAGCLYALANLPLVIEGELLNETLQTFLLATMLVSLIPRDRASPWRLLVAAAAGGLAILTRPTSALFAAPALAIALLGRRRELGWGRIALASLLFLAISGAAAVRNRVIGGEWVPISYNGGINFFVGNAALHDELMDIRPGLVWERLVQSPRALEQTGVYRIDPWAEGYKAWDDRYYRAALEDMAWAPAGAAWRLVRKTLQFWSSYEIERNVNPSAFIARGSVLAWTTLPFAVLAPPAFAGLVLLVRRRARGSSLVLLGVVSVWATCIVFFVTSRYRMPAYPMLALAASHAILTGIATRSKLVLAALVLALVIGITDPGGARGIAHARGTYLRGVALERTGDEIGALRAYEEAAREAPNDPDCLFSPTAILLRLGKPEEARSFAARATTALPDHPSPWFNLGLACELQGRYAEAIEAFRRLIDVKPSETKAYYQLGRTLIDAGDPETALAPLAQAALMAPRMGLPWLERARALAMLGRRDEAREALLRGARIDPGIVELAKQHPALSALAGP